MIEIIIYEDGSQTRADLSQDWGVVFSDKKAPCVESVTLYPVGKFSGRAAWSGKAVWEVRVDKSVWCKDLGTVVVGQTPRGFKEVTALPPGSAGEYKLVIRGAGVGEASLGLD